MEKWSEEAFRAAAGEIEAIENLPFMAKLADGSLPQEIFNQYIAQDINYLDQFTRELAHCASRVDRTRDVERILNFAIETIAIRRSIIESFPYIHKSEPTSANLRFSALMVDLEHASEAAELAALLPCFWAYQLIGEHVISLARLDGNPYRDWILTYSDPAFNRNTEEFTEICNRYAAEASPETRNRMTRAFINGVKVLGSFWDYQFSNL